MRTPSDLGRISILLFIGLAAISGVGIATLQTRAESGCWCLPETIKKETVVKVITRMTDQRVIKEYVTVLDTLKSIRATCRGGKLLDGKGIPIRFYELRSCWGAPPANYAEIIDKQTKEIEALKNSNTVIEIPCNPDPLLPPAGIPQQNITIGNANQE